MSRRRGRLLPKLVAIPVVLIIAWLAYSSRSVRYKETRIVIPRGANLRAAADSLAGHGIIRNALVFRTYAKVTGRDRSIRAGTYIVKPDMSWSQLLDEMSTGRNMDPSITIPEGWSISQIVPQLARVLQVDTSLVASAVRDTSLLHELDIPTPTLEGYLFPDTYVVPPGTTPREAVHLMVSRFEQVWQPAWDSILQKRAMTRNDIMALAAIVEKEARRPEERPVIAAVYMNRVKAGMLLQADPTVQYAIGHHVTRVLYKDLTIDSKYNTYKYKGLPPGPIASPGKPSILAALNPANVPYRYFVAHPDGHHEFTADFAAHSAAVKRARREWDSVAVARRDTLQQAPASLIAGAATTPPPTTAPAKPAQPAPRKK